MKKYLMFLVLFFSIFFGFNIVNAEEVTLANYSNGTGNNVNNLEITYDFDLKRLYFYNEDVSSANGYITITKTNFLFLYDNVAGRVYVQQYDTDVIYLINATTTVGGYTRYGRRFSLSTSYDRTGLDQWWYNFGAVGSFPNGPNNNWTWTNNSSLFYRDDVSNQNFDVFKDTINSTTDILDSSSDVFKEKNIQIGPLIVNNKVIDLGDNTFGFYQNYLGLNLTTLTGSVDTLSVVCENDKPFYNNYCFIDYDDLINHNSDITVFNNYGASFTQTFGSNTGYLLNDRYYLYSFRIQKPFVPHVGNLFINSLTNNSNKVDILGVYLQDGGSYTDYVIKFKISNSDYTSSTSLNDIMVVFRDGLSAYYSSIPISFNYSVYRSFKLQYFSSEPTMEQVNNFYDNSDLSTIDGVSSNNSFFTDNDFKTYGFGGIVTAPFRFLYAIENYDTCSDISLPFPHSNDTITLRCVRNSIPSSITPLITILQLILSGFILYRIAVQTLSIIKDISSPKDEDIEVIDL